MAALRCFVHACAICGVVLASSWLSAADRETPGSHSYFSNFESWELMLAEWCIANQTCVEEQLHITGVTEYHASRSAEFQRGWFRYFEHDWIELDMADVNLTRPKRIITQAEGFSQYYTVQKGQHIHWIKMPSELIFIDSDNHSLVRITPQKDTMSWSALARNQKKMFTFLRGPLVPSEITDFWECAKFHVEGKSAKLEFVERQKDDATSATKRRPSRVSIRLEMQDKRLLLAEYHFDSPSMTTHLTVDARTPNVTTLSQLRQEVESLEKSFLRHQIK